MLPHRRRHRAPAVALIGGFHVADLTGGGTTVAVTAAADNPSCTLECGANGVHPSSARPGSATVNGWAAVGTAANILVWLFVGWEAMAQLADGFRDPARDLPRAVALAFATVAVLYVGLAVATIAIGSTSEVPLADLLATGLGETGRDVTAVLAADAIGPDDIVRATSACFVAVYLLSLGAGVRILPGRLRAIALAALTLMAVLAIFSAAFLLVPVAAAVISLVVSRE